MLPTSRNTTYTPASPVKSADLCDLQDCIVGAKHPLLTLQLPIFGVVNTGIGLAAVSYAHGSTHIVTSANKIDASISIPALPVGTRIVNVRAVVGDSSSGPGVKVAFRTTDLTDAFLENAITATSSGAGAFQILTLASLNHYVGVSSAGPAYINFTTPTNGTAPYEIVKVEIDIDRL